MLVWQLSCVCAYFFTVQLDGTKSKEQLYNFVFGDVLNGIQMCV